MRGDSQLSRGPRPVVRADEYRAHRRWYRNGHVQTVVGNFLRRSHSLPEPTAEVVQVEGPRGPLPATSVLCHCHWQPAEVRSQRLTVLLLHGLEGSSNSHYIVGNADKAWHAGCNVVRMNMRSCGGTDQLSPTIYHCGLSGDVQAVMEHMVRHYQLQQVALVGYSMGGNLVLKYAGEVANHPPPELRAVVGVSPVIDLSLSSTSLHAWQNRAYEWNFLRGLVQRYRAKAAMWPNYYAPQDVDGVRSIRDFDDRVVAKYAGFADAEDYYQQTGAARFVQDIRVPTLVLHALDDPFIKLSQQTRSKLEQNPSISLLETPHGGHCAFLTTETSAGFGTRPDGYWAERTLLRFLLGTVPEDQQGSTSVVDAIGESVQ